MASSSKRKWTVTKADGTTVEVTGTRMDEEHGVVRIYDGDEFIARYINAQSIEPS
jgi:hypothetical protein